MAAVQQSGKGRKEEARSRRKKTIRHHSRSNDPRERERATRTDERCFRERAKEKEEEETPNETEGISLSPRAIWQHRRQKGLQDQVVF